jgi:hypothetical protein
MYVHYAAVFRKLAAAVTPRIGRSSDQSRFPLADVLGRDIIP